MSEPVTVSSDDLQLLLWCAMDYDRRLPGQLIPAHLWELLPQASKDNINRWHLSDRDVLGAQRRSR